MLERIALRDHAAERMTDEVKPIHFELRAEPDQIVQELAHDVLPIGRRRFPETTEIEPDGAIAGTSDGFDLWLPFSPRVPDAVHEQDGGTVSRGVPSEPGSVGNVEKP